MKSSAIKCDMIKRSCQVSGGKWWKMPSDIVSFAVSTGLGVSVLAGILSGVCYVLAHGIQKKRYRKPNREWYCDVCGVYLRSIDGILEGDKVITCTKCQGRVCKHRCSSLVQQKGWTCKSCLRPPETWFQGILSAIQPSSKVNLVTKMNPDSLNELDEDLEAIRKREKEQVRDFIERLVNVMLGEDVDDASVTKLYNDTHYLPITGQSPCTAHAALKQLIERLLQEAINLPSLQKAQEHPAAPSDESNRTYEDLLATAIINKVISSCQNNLPTSSAASVSSRISNSSRNRDDREYFFGEETLDSKWKTTDLDTSSVSSLEEWIQSDSSLGSKKYVDRVTLTIKQDIEEVSLTESDNENEEDDKDYFRSALLDEDEQNWFLQKRQFQGTHSPVPVPMLVPNPITEAKVLIGDREVDDTSDLSDVASDYGDTETVPGQQSLLLESKKVIGGKNPLQNGGSESESSADSGVKEVDSTDRSGYDGPIFLSKTDITVDDDNVEDESILSVYSNTEKEAEYTERYGSLPRTIMKTPTPPSRPSLQRARFSGTANLGDDANKEIAKSEQIDEDDEERKIRECSGRYSKREKEKWKHAIEMKNNPYSKENIEKRIKRSSSAVSSLFGPDYYARQASSPSGGKLTPTEILKELHWPPPRAKDEDEKENIHKAVPVIVSQDDEIFYAIQTEVEPITPELKPQVCSVLEVAEPSVSELTSDSDLSYVNFYDVENSQIYRKTKEGEEVTLINAKALPEEPPSKEKSDENGNLASEKDKHPEGGSDEDIEVITKIAPQVTERKVISRTKVENRPNFAKATPAVRQRNLQQPPSAGHLKRFKSETDLLDDSFDRPPTVISRKKDNTLISKIYLDPHVRNFALTKRDHLPVEERTEAKPALSNQMSVDDNVFAFSTTFENNKQTNYNSDDNVSIQHSPKKLYYSSEEDLLSFGDSSARKGDSSVPQIHQNASVKNYRVKSSRQSSSSEDGLLSDQGSVNLGKPYRKKSTRSLIYSSNEDLLSVEDVEKTPKKKDNTLIFKIYQDPNVRNFALTNRDHLPVPDDKISISSKRGYSSEEDLLSDNSTSKVKPHKTPTVTESNGHTAPAEVSLESSKIKASSLPPSPMHQKYEVESDTRLNSPDPDIDELARKKIVHNLLGQFSKSQSNLLEIDKTRKVSRERKMSVDTEEAKVSVKDLKKKFENNDAKNRVISSLTARSLSKQMRETLRN